MRLHSKIQNHTPQHASFFHFVEHGINFSERSRLGPAFDLALGRRLQDFAQLLARTDRRPDNSVFARTMATVESGTGSGDIPTIASVPAFLIERSAVS